MSKVSIIGIDLAKSVFQLHGNDQQGHMRLKKKLKRSQLLEALSNQPKCLVAMEACCGSHYWARKIMAMGHEVKIIAPQYVKPFVQVNKNDARDAMAIAEAAARPAMPSVTIKSVEQLDLQGLHRVRERLQKEKTAVGNELRGLLAEMGIVFPVGDKSIRVRVVEVLEDLNNGMSVCGRELINDLREQWLERETRIVHYDKALKRFAKANQTCRYLQTIPGIGPIISTLLYSYVGDPKSYKTARHFSAALGLVPRQFSSGGKDVLLGISKKGNKHVRKQLVHGARSAFKMLSNSEKDDRLSRWVKQMLQRKHPNKVIIALANKLARIAWVIMSKQECYQVKVHVPS